MQRRHSSLAHMHSFRCVRRVCGIPLSTRRRIPVRAWRLLSFPLRRDVANPCAAMSLSCLHPAVFMHRRCHRLHGQIYKTTTRPIQHGSQRTPAHAPSPGGYLRRAGFRQPRKINFASHRQTPRIRKRDFRPRNIPRTAQFCRQIRLTRLIKRGTDFVITACCARRSRRAPGLSFAGRALTP